MIIDTYFCTVLYEAGIDLKSDKHWMGHADEKIILRVYAHLTDYQERRSAEKLRAYLAGKKRTTAAAIHTAAASFRL